MKNRATSLENTGYSGSYDDVNLYWGIDQGGSYACLGQGDHWLDLSIHAEHFDHWGTGNGQPLYNNIASHSWTDSC
ncbi:hypothetical protein [Streptomyces sp. SID12488]|uniref:hypothetical protein n=1 Tax=Streptomyces sp. SID12488 TaxID=2706040 RepID=UPI0013DAB287|nr:hypothetical protein [Streptomyces sp. SID12488]NEA63966.1 hypothetical protein [Streptomyces sp. SID12488]